MSVSTDMPALRTRMQAVIDAGQVRNASAWSAAAGLARSHVSTILAGKTKRVETATIFRLADAAQISRAWLAFGEGEMIEAAPTVEEVSAFEGALGWFVATEEHEGRGDEARRFLAQREQANAGVTGLSPDAWLAKLRDEYRAWRRPSKACRRGSRASSASASSGSRAPSIAGACHVSTASR